MSNPVFADRVQETFTTTGVGPVSLGGPVTGYQPFSNVLTNGQSCYYGATDGTNWEIGIGTYATSGDLLSRSQILASSNANAAVNWAAGTKSIWLGASAALLSSINSAHGYQNNTAAPGATTSTTGLMMGLAGSFVPFYSGVVFVCIDGTVSNSIGVGGASLSLRYGTGTAPANGAAPAGTRAGSAQAVTMAGSGYDTAFSLSRLISNMANGTAYWLDLEIAVVSGTATPSNVNISAFEVK